MSTGIKVAVWALAALATLIVMTISSDDEAVEFVEVDLDEPATV